MKLSDKDCDKVAVMAQDLFTRKLDAMSTREIATKYKLSLPKARHIMWGFAIHYFEAYDGSKLCWNDGVESGHLKHIYWFFG